MGGGSTCSDQWKSSAGGAGSQIFVVGRRVSQPMTGTRCWSEKPRGGGRWPLCRAPSWAPKVSWRSLVKVSLLSMYGALSTRQETTIWLTFPDANKIIIGQPDLKYHKIERTGSDNQKCSPSNILPSSLFWVRMVWVGLEREVFLVICSEMASREEGHWWCPLPLGPT